MDTNDVAVRAEVPDAAIYMAVRWVMTLQKSPCLVKQIVIVGQNTLNQLQRKCLV